MVVKQESKRREEQERGPTNKVSRTLSTHIDGTTSAAGRPGHDASHTRPLEFLRMSTTSTTPSHWNQSVLQKMDPYRSSVRVCAPPDRGRRAMSNQRRPRPPIENNRPAIPRRARTSETGLREECCKLIQVESLVRACVRAGVYSTVSLQRVGRLLPSHLF